MKSIFIVILLCLSFPTAFSQNNKKGKEPITLSNNYIVESVIAYSTNGVNSKYTYTYDSKGNMLTRIYEKWQSEQWIKCERDTYTYDSKGNNLTDLYEKWENEQWVNYDRYTYISDPYGNIFYNSKEKWIDGQWLNYIRYTLTFDSTKNQVNTISECFKNGQWINSGKQTYIYDSNGNWIFWLLEEWQNGQWVNHYRYTRSNDLNGNQLTYIREEWQNGQWVTSKESYTYDSSGNKLTALYEGDQNGQLVIFSQLRYINKYDLNGNLLTAISEQLNKGLWENFDRNTYIYDSKGNLITHLFEHMRNGQWVNDERRTYMYDSNGNLLAELSDVWRNKWIGTDGYFSFNDSKGQIFSFAGYKIEINSVMIETENNSLSLNCYPNPTSGLLSINYTITKSEPVSLTVTNILGAEISRIYDNIIQEPDNYILNFNAVNLAIGVYYLTIKAGNYTETKKFVIIR
jgi:hypothetical protein